jgi:hypothetical protein
LGDVDHRHHGIAPFGAHFHCAILSPHPRKGLLFAPVTMLNADLRGKSSISTLRPLVWNYSKEGNR